MSFVGKKKNEGQLRKTVQQRFFSNTLKDHLISVTQNLPLSSTISRMKFKNGSMGILPHKQGTLVFVVQQRLIMQNIMSN